MNKPSFADIEAGLAETRRQLTEQDREWVAARDGIASLGDVQIAVRSLPDFSPPREVVGPVVGLRG